MQGSDERVNVGEDSNANINNKATSGTEHQTSPHRLTLRRGQGHAPLIGVAQLGIMGEAAVDVSYLSVGANRHTAIADWSSDGLLAFGADSNIALWRPDASSPFGVSHLLSGHKEVVKAVKFLPRHDSGGPHYIVSGGDDHLLKLWAVHHDGNVECVQTLQDHQAAIHCIAVPAAQCVGSDVVRRTILATGSADATIRIWALDSGNLQLLQTLKTKPKYFPLALALSPLDDQHSSFVLASAGTKDIIQIYSGSKTSDGTLQFSLQATLSGHEGWIRSLDFTREKPGPAGDILLASASQDKYVRLWRIHRGKDLPAQAAMGQDSAMGAFLPGKSPSNKAHRIKAGDEDYSVSFEALLFGHDDWIYSAKWHAAADGSLRLLSASADNSLAIWEADASTGVWVTTARLGELSREKGATTATGSIGGFWTGLWSPSGESVVVLGRTGSWRRWAYDSTAGRWIQALSITGHTRAVTGISWSRDGRYLLSTSSDQTTRLHAEWKPAGQPPTWHEMSRPQIHGYDLNCISALGASQFVSGADEKLMRVFSEPKAVAKMIARLTGGTESDPASIDAMPDAANVPVLGLSNKAIDAVDDDEELAPMDDFDHNAVDPASVVRKSTLDFDHPPFEESLSRHTLWPEVEKLYGHGYEISCLAASHDGSLVASACKASSTNHAVIRLFETRGWTEVRPPLVAHSLTAARLRFSSDDHYLLSVGRDRQWAVFERTDAVVGGGDERRLTYAPLQLMPKAHTRMILDCAWAPYAGGERRVFATAGRDKSVKVWGEKEADGKRSYELVTTLAGEHPVTAVEFLWRRPSEEEDLILAVGNEVGKLSIYRLARADLSLRSKFDLPERLWLPKPVLQLAWRPAQDDRNAAGFDLAVAGEDSSLRVYTVTGL
ncbi:uncharacterized protein E0L32_012050 [Thyridium curvatum]|uniref:Elongator complex protein 2 n=1 Tax=Thyridium curvatum TaxID=1093900 RepID=A0A507BJR7_9PEZI|nr:uncharacterized protein E0L32_012050 [Thyridium curvatum]TPX17639.1 hypothetical protein E0L32_012050 [Thyridium curvatum]